MLRNALLGLIIIGGLILAIFFLLKFPLYEYLPAVIKPGIKPSPSPPTSSLCKETIVDNKFKRSEKDNYFVRTWPIITLTNLTNCTLPPTIGHKLRVSWTQPNIDFLVSLRITYAGSDSNCPKDIVKFTKTPYNNKFEFDIPSSIENKKVCSGDYRILLSSSPTKFPLIFSSLFKLEGGKDKEPPQDLSLEEILKIISKLEVKGSFIDFLEPREGKTEEIIGDFTTKVSPPSNLLVLFVDFESVPGSPANYFSKRYLENAFNMASEKFRESSYGRYSYNFKIIGDPVVVQTKPPSEDTNPIDMALFYIKLIHELVNKKILVYNDLKTLLSPDTATYVFIVGDFNYKYIFANADIGVFEYIKIPLIRLDFSALERSKSKGFSFKDFKFFAHLINHEIGHYLHLDHAGRLFCEARKGCNLYKRLLNYLYMMGYPHGWLDYYIYESSLSILVFGGAERDSAKFLSENEILRVDVNKIPPGDFREFTLYDLDISGTYKKLLNLVPYIYLEYRPKYKSIIFTLENYIKRNRPVGVMITDEEITDPLVITTFRSLDVGPFNLVVYFQLPNLTFTMPPDDFFDHIFPKIDGNILEAVIRVDKSATANSVNLKIIRTPYIEITLPKKNATLSGTSPINFLAYDHFLDEQFNANNFELIIDGKSFKLPSNLNMKVRQKFNYARQTLGEFNFDFTNLSDGLHKMKMRFYKQGKFDVYSKDVSFYVKNQKVVSLSAPLCKTYNLPGFQPGSQCPSRYVLFKNVSLPVEITITPTDNLENQVTKVELRFKPLNRNPIPIYEVPLRNFRSVVLGNTSYASTTENLDINAIIDTKVPNSEDWRGYLYAEAVLKDNRIIKSQELPVDLIKPFVEILEPPNGSHFFNGDYMRTKVQIGLPNINILESVDVELSDLPYGGVSVSTTSLVSFLKSDFVNNCKNLEGKQPDGGAVICGSKVVEVPLSLNEGSYQLTPKLNIVTPQKETITGDFILISVGNKMLTIKYPCYFEIPGYFDPETGQFKPYPGTYTDIFNNPNCRGAQISCSYTIIGYYSYDCCRYENIYTGFSSSCIDFTAPLLP